MCGKPVLRITIVVVMPELSPAVTILLGAFDAFAWRPEYMSVAPAIIIPLGLERFHDDCTNMTWTCSAVSRQIKERKWICRICSAYNRKSDDEGGRLAKA
jgi:hypothetical protein